MYRLLFFSMISFLGFQNNIVAQQLISYEFIQHYTVQDLNTALANFGLTGFNITPKYEVDYYKITYTTPNAQNTGNTFATGALVVPSNISCPLPVISYQHGTTSIRYNVPSARGGNEYYIGLLGAALTGSVVCMSDYLGLGDSPGFHPYVHAKSEAQACIDLLRTARELKDTLNYNLNDQLFLFGYSQGGHSTMALFKEIETNLANEFTVTACAPMSGPYDVSGVQSATMTADSFYSSPGYLPYVIMGYQEAYGNVYNDLSEIFRPPYDSLLPGYFNGTHSMGWINNRLPDTPNLMLDTAYFNDFLTNPNHFAWTLLRDNDLYNWAPVAPLHMYYCTADEQVFYRNSEVARDSMHALGATHVVATSFGALSHSGCAPFCFLASLALFESYIDLSGGMSVTDSIQSPSSNTATDASIILTPNNGSAPYTYEWLGALAGQNSNTVSGLGVGNYEVVVSDSRGCNVNLTLNVDASTSSHALEALNFYRIIPNPASNEVFIKILASVDDAYKITIRDLSGRLVMESGEEYLHLQRLELDELSNGIYMLSLEHGNNHYTQLLNIQK